MAPLVTYIIGDGAHAHDIGSDLCWRNLGRDPGIFHYVPHHSEFGLAIHRPNDRFIIGINDLHVRQQVARDIGAPGIDNGVWVHSRAYEGGDVQVGQGTHVNYGTQMVRTDIGDYCTISPGVTICGDVTIGNRVMVGAGATIINLITIGDDAVIGAGAVVLEDIGPGETWVGNPARRIK